MLELTEIERKARDKASQMLAAAEDRQTAALMADQKDRGERTSQQVLAVWRRAIGRDPGDFWSWVFVARPQPGADEKAAWKQALSQRARMGYRDYLGRFPNGAFAQEAQSRLAACHDETTITWSPIADELPSVTPQASQTFPMPMQPAPPTSPR